MNDPTKTRAPLRYRKTLTVSIEISKDATNEVPDEYWRGPTPSEVADFIRRTCEDKETDDGWHISQVWW